MGFLKIIVVSLSNRLCNNLYMLEFFNYMELEGKVVIVTGSSHGIGRETGRQLLNLGAKVVFVARGKEKLKGFEKEFSKKDFLFLILDLSVKENCKKLIDATVKKFGRIDVLVNNLGRGFRGQFRDVDPDTFQEAVSVNLLSASYCTKYALSEIEKQKGSIVFISSAAGIHGLPCYGLYSASKCAIATLAEILRVELHDSKVHIGTVIFGPVTVERNKPIMDKMNVQKFLRKTKGFISVETAAGKIVSCIKRRQNVVLVTWLTKLLFCLDRFSPAFTTYLLRTFRCPEDYT